jgi:hypothetical protein
VQIALTPGLTPVDTREWGFPMANGLTRNAKNPHFAGFFVAGYFTKAVLYL